MHGARTCANPAYTPLTNGKQHAIIGSGARNSALTLPCLQIAVPNEVLIYDLVALSPHLPALNSCLASSFQAARPGICGLGLEKDLNRLHAACPALTAVQDLPNILDLR